MKVYIVMRFHPLHDRASVGEIDSVWLCEEHANRKARKLRTKSDMWSVRVDEEEVAK